MSLIDLIRDHDIRQPELARVLGLTQSAVSLKLSGKRPWKSAEITALLTFLSQRLGRDVTYEEAFIRDPVPAAVGE